MKLKENLTTTLLLTIGLLLHYIVPGLVLGMKFDFLLIFMFIAIFINPSRQNIVLTSFLAGLMSAMTTTFPAGQLPNMVDKLATGLVLYIMISPFKQGLTKPVIIIISLLATLFSGTVFLLSAKYMLGADISLASLVKFVVIPTSLINSFGTIFIYNIVLKSLRLENIH